MKKTKKPSIPPTFPTVPPPIISYGKKIIDLLGYLSENQTQNFNKRRYAIDKGISRSSLYEMLQKLQTHNYVYSHTGNVVITNKGLEFIGKVPQEIEVSGPCRKRGKNILSLHNIEFKGKISFPLEINPNMMKKLNPDSLVVREMPTWKYYNCKYQNATVQLFPYQYVIRLHEITAETTEECLEKAFLEATKYTSILDEAGIKLQNIKLVSQHLAKQSGLFAHLLQKIDDNYFYTLKSGSKIWIDRSKDIIEDESQDPRLRMKMDKFIEDLSISKSEYADLDKIKYVIASLVDLESQRFTKKFNFAPNSENQKIDYIG